VSVPEEIVRLIGVVSGITGGQLDVLVNNAGNLTEGGLVRARSMMMLLLHWHARN
jgi:NAD(P)-dependent dehydrogenase (short-subunit alcohol dehydrogenase family)